MGRIVDLDDLANVEQIAEHYGITRQAVDLWTRKDDFPAPVVTWAGRVWLLPDVTAWRDAQPPPRQPAGHGTKTRYNAGCRCDNCKTANNEARRVHIANSTPLPADDPRHGTANAYVNYNCRCGPCREAGSVNNRNRRKNRLERSKR